MKNIQMENDQYRSKCNYLETELSNKIHEIEVLKQDLERYEVEQLTGSAGEQGSKHGALSVSALRIESDQLRKDNTRLLGML